MQVDRRGNIRGKAPVGVNTGCEKCNGAGREFLQATDKVSEEFRFTTVVVAKNILTCCGIDDALVDVERTAWLVA